MPASDWVPSVDAVGAILRARTRDTQGNEVGTFSPDTRPTETQVSSLIESAAEDLTSVAGVGVDLAAPLWPLATVAATYKAAMLVELSYFPEQVAQGRSPYAQLRDLYLEAIASLKAALVDVPGGAPGAPEAPSYGFPVLSTLDVVLGPLPGGYSVPYNGGLYQ